jgi:Mlc titration factor MtfA (ptsG expression regulator)
MSWWKRLIRWRAGSRNAVCPAPFPKPWRRVLESSVPFFRRLPHDQRDDLLAGIQRFIAEKEFLGSKGLTVTDDMKVVIAAYACLLVLRIPQFGLYPQTREVIVYPHNFGQTIEAIGPDGRRYRIDLKRIGEAWRRGPVLLAWDSVERLTRTPRARHNVIIHEFAHALDFLDGLADGTPPLDSGAGLADWVRVFTREYETLIATARTGGRTLLDPYGTANPAEFFAVASECFFEQPQLLREHHPGLYRQLRAFYHQDPAAWPD